MKKPIFCIAGGDLRFGYLASYLSAQWYKILALGLEKCPELPKTARLCTPAELSRADVVILPLPCCTKDGKLKTPFPDRSYILTELLGAMKEGTMLIGGKIPEETVDAARLRAISVCDYAEREDFAVRNAALTAEAAVALAMEIVEESLSGMKVLVLGHGRIGRLLASMLKALDADVTVAARRFSDLAWIRSEGMRPLEFSRINQELDGFRLIFNTVPALILEKEKLMLMRKDAIVIDLASEPGGTDFAAAAELHIHAEKALGLPGKFAPKTAGEILADTVQNILKEREDALEG
jgi:dipicolinate synthase subunit A